MIFDVAGRQVRRFQGLGGQGLNSVTWDGRDDTGRSVASGVYLYRLVTPAGSEARRMTLLR